MSEPCSAPDCDKDAIVRYHITPRRDVEPLTDEVRRATCWPGAASPVWVPICGARACYDALRAAAVTVLGPPETLGDAVATRTVQE
jgi:hypothetical protein